MMFSIQGNALVVLSMVAAASLQRVSAFARSPSSFRDTQCNQRNAPNLTRSQGATAPLARCRTDRARATAGGATVCAMSEDYSPSTIQGAWDNHFGAFGGKNLDNILLDYDDSSIITTYDQTANEKTVYEGVEGARSLFTGLFKALSDLSDLAAPVAEVSEESKMVFLVWRCPASGFMDATDTFVFGDNKKIYRQTVAFRTG